MPRHTRIYSGIVIIFSLILMGLSVIGGTSMSVRADLGYICENGYSRYLVISDLYSEITSYRQDHLPYTALGSMYFDGRWKLPDGFDHSETIRYATIIDFQTGEVHFIYINQGRWFVNKWGSFEVGDDGNPHLGGAYWVQKALSR